MTAPVAEPTHCPRLDITALKVRGGSAARSSGTARPSTRAWATSASKPMAHHCSTVNGGEAGVGVGAPSASALGATAGGEMPWAAPRDMWDRLTASMPTVTPESTFRQPIRRFTVSRPPVPLVVSPVFPRCTGCVCLRSLWDSPRIVSFGVVSRAKRSE